MNHGVACLSAGLLLACGGGHPPAQRVFDATTARPVATAPAQVPVADTSLGAVQVHVTWLTAAAAMRASTGRLHCGDAKPARAHINTTGGVAAAVVLLQSTGAGVATHAAVLRLENCLLTPRVVVQSLVAANQLLITSDARERQLLHIDRIADDIDHAIAAAVDVARGNVVALPWAGASLRLPLSTAQVVRVATDDDRDVATWVVITAAPWSAVTDDSGTVSFAAMPAGHYTVTAWLPPAAGAPAMIAHGELSVVGKMTTSLVFDLENGAATITSQPLGTAADSNHAAD